MKNKKLFLILISIILVIILINLGISLKQKHDLKGDWCKYRETATIVVLLNRDHTLKDRQSLEKKVEEFENITGVEYISREEYAKQLNQDLNTLDIYDTYRISLSSMDAVTTYMDELKKFKFVHQVDQNYAKANFQSYKLKSWGKYSYRDSDEASPNDYEYGKYKIKKGIIKFTPKNKGKERFLYIKDKHLCSDTSCTEIFIHDAKACTTK